MDQNLTTTLGAKLCERAPDLHGGGENLRFQDFVVLPFSAQMFLAALVYDGLFDRVPDLRGGVIEFGAASKEATRPEPPCRRRPTPRRAKGRRAARSFRCAMV